MSNQRDPSPRSARFRWGVSGAALAALALATFTTAADAKVVWDDPTFLTPSERHDFCKQRPLFRAERLARRQSFIVQRSLLTPYTVTPYGIFVPTFQTGWFWFDRVPIGGQVCDD